MIRIQLSSNYQVVELTFDKFENINQIELSKAVDLVNKLGEEVIADVKKPANSAKKTVAVQKPSSKQISYAVSLGISRKEALEMSAKELHKAIEDAKNGYFG